MSEEKLDLILTVVSELKGDVKRIDSRMGNLENEFGSFKLEVNSRFDTLEKKFDSKIDSLEQKFDSKIDSLEKEFKDFKIQVIQAFKSLNSRIDTLEKQMFAIGVEVKEEIRYEISDVRKELNRLENKIILEQAEKFNNQSERLKQEVVMRELAERVQSIEINLKAVNLKLAA